MRWIIGSLAALTLVAGCSLYNARPLPRSELFRSPFRNTDESVIMIVQPLDMFEDTNEYFNADLLGEGILPFYVMILNAGDSPIRLNRSQIRLAYNGGRPLGPTPARAIAGKLASSKFGALRMGMMGLWMAFRTDYERTSDYLKKELPLVVRIAPHEGVDGVVFFQLGQPVRDALGSKLRFRIRNEGTHEDRDIALSILEFAPAKTVRRPAPSRN
ncbi:MAG: hypothetical protein ACE5IM_12390 [Nitrospinota bacterium]